jgi:hypothetical protein
MGVEICDHLNFPTDIRLIPPGEFAHMDSMGIVWALYGPCFVILALATVHLRCVKQQPRQTLKEGQLLKKRLKSLGYTASNLPQVRRLDRGTKKIQQDSRRQFSDFGGPLKNYKN